MKILVAGAIANKPGYGGEAWVRLAWVRGLEALGAEVLFAEELSAPGLDAMAPEELAEDPRIAFFERVCSGWGLAGRSALVTPEGGSLSGLPSEAVLDFARDADLLVNISGHLKLRPVMQAVRRRAYVDLDPGYTQFWRVNGETELGLEAHDVHFTVGTNIGRASCVVPDAGFRWHPIRQPVLLDEWPEVPPPPEPRFTTVASWRGAYGAAEFAGRRFGLKAHEFRRFIRLPSLVGAPVEVALDIAPADDDDRRALERERWVLVDPAAVAGDPGRFRSYIRGSGAELSVAQGVYVSTRCGWFSDRSARYLATGRPVIVQDTGVGRTLPLGEGLFTFRTLDAATTATRNVLRDYERHRRAARRVAEEYFDARPVLSSFLERALYPARPRGERPPREESGAEGPWKPGRPAPWRRRDGTRTGGRGRRALISGMVAGVPGQGGATWAVLQYVLGLERLGWEVHLVDELHKGDLRPAGVTLEQSDNARYFRAVCREFGLEGRASLLAADSDASVGPSRRDLARVAGTAGVLLNLSGRLADRHLIDRVPIRVYLDLDPAFTQLWHEQDGLDLGLAGHTHYATVGLELGVRHCPVPTGGFEWIPTLPPVVLEEWATAGPAERDAWTTVANWRGYGSIRRDGVHYGQKAHAFRGLLDLPERTGDRFDLALSIHPGERADIEALESHGWRLLDPGRAAGSPDAYRRFILGSAAEVGVAKTGYVTSRCGWFSDRSACYLAAGRPVLAQDTGFSRHLPVGRGLVPFGTLEEAVDGVHAIRRDYAGHSAAARRIAEEHLDSHRVLGDLLRKVDAW